MTNSQDAQTLHYLDPPYVHETRARTRGEYVHEMTPEQHAELLAFIPTLKGMVVLSGYPHPAYDEALKGWRRIEREALADGARKRIEVIWTNAPAKDADLFSEATA